MVTIYILWGGGGMMIALLLETFSPLSDVVHGLTVVQLVVTVVCLIGHLCIGATRALTQLPPPFPVDSVVSSRIVSVVYLGPPPVLQSVE